jgi:signal peptidase I
MPTPAAQESTSWLESIQSLLSTLVIAVFIITFAVQAFQIPSESMEKTLLIGDYLLVDKLHFGGNHDSGKFIPYHHVQRGDIVVFHYPVNPSQHFVKRVIGLPKDRIRLVNKQVWVNGAPLQENYVQFLNRPSDVFRDNFPRLDFLSAGIDPRWYLELRDHVDRGELVVPDGKYFVMGDNRDDSLDSRYWGFVPEGNIVGRPLLIYWSVRDSQGEQPSASDKIGHSLYMLTHLFHVTRWDRTFHVVR